MESIAGLNPDPLDPLKIPACVYSHPQMASLGLTEPEAEARGRPLAIGRFPFMANGKALALGDTEGMVKVIFDKGTGEILGVHMIGSDVTELLPALGVAQSLEATEEDLVHTIFPHPTLSEAIHEAVLNALGRGIHM